MPDPGFRPGLITFALWAPFSVDPETARRNSAEPTSRNFFEFTVAFVRSVAYSLGTLAGFYFAKPVTPPVIETKVVM